MNQRIHRVDRLVGERVRLLRLARGISQTALGSRIGVTFQQVQKYEKGVNRISASKIVEIANTLGVDVSDLFEGAAESTATSDARERDAYIPTAVDLSIIRTLSEIRDTKMKRRILDLISSLASETNA
jgi:transcriptional regulator with XRE-family HTH domain